VTVVGWLGWSLVWMLARLRFGVHNWCLCCLCCDCVCLLLVLPHTRPLQQYVGPTEESNWVLLDRLLVGAYPAALDDALNDEIVSSILRLGIDTFVCLQAEYQHANVTEAQWRSGEKLRCVGLGVCVVLLCCGVVVWI